MKLYENDFVLPIGFDSFNESFILNKNNMFFDKTFCDKTFYDKNIEFIVNKTNKNDKTNKNNKKFKTTQINGIYPIKSLMIFLDETEFLFTDFTYDDYKYKEINVNTHINYILSKPNTHTFFDSSKLYGIINENESLYVEIHIWDIPLPYKEYNQDIFMNVNKHIVPITLYIDYIDYEFFETLLYKDISIFNKIKNDLNNKDNWHINNTSSVGNHFLIGFDNCPLLQTKKNDELKKYGDISDIINIISTKTISSNNKFYNYKIHKNFLQQDICKWIILESNIGQNNEILLENVKPVFNYIKILLETLTKHIMDSYLLNININYINIKLLKCVKDFVSDCFFVMVIPLTKCLININETIELNIGDLLLINSQREMCIDESLFILFYVALDL
uniref:Uncharacterized protein n=1 Tax=viral metagenome TaxID=1070528 RepID=A0A6C0EUR0_9ZZZZ